MNTRAKSNECLMHDTDGIIKTKHIFECPSCGHFNKFSDRERALLESIKILCDRISFLEHDNCNLQQRNLYLATLVTLKGLMEGTNEIEYNIATFLSRINN